MVAHSQLAQVGFAGTGPGPQPAVEVVVAGRGAVVVPPAVTVVPTVVVVTAQQLLLPVGPAPRRAVPT